MPQVEAIREREKLTQNDTVETLWPAGPRLLPKSLGKHPHKTTFKRLKWILFARSQRAAEEQWLMTTR